MGHQFLFFDVFWADGSKKICNATTSITAQNMGEHYRYCTTLNGNLAIKVVGAGKEKFNVFVEANLLRLYKIKSDFKRYLN